MKSYLLSYDFSRGVLMAFTVLVFGLITYFSGNVDAIPAVTIGVLLTSFCDLQGDIRKRVFTMGLSILMNSLSFLLISFIIGNTLLLFIGIAVLVFFISYLGVFGHRANMLAFSGLMGVVLSMVQRYDGPGTLEHVLLMCIGGVGYIIMSTLFHFLTKKRQVNEKLAELIALNANFIHLQWERNQLNQKVDESKRLDLHQQITEKQESLRELLFTNELLGGASKTRNRQMLMLVELIDIAELTMANPIDVYSLRQHPNWNEELFKEFQDELHQQYVWLKKMELFLRTDKPINFTRENSPTREDFSQKIQEFAESHDIIKVRAISLALLNYKDYLERQTAKIANVQHLLQSRKNKELQPILEVYREKFVSSEEYTLQGFKESFQLSSPILRHSIRLTVSMVGGYFLGLLLNVENPYWIMLTVVVIMRPSYGLTKQRSIQRVLGTIVGVLISIGIVLITNNFYVYLSIALTSMIFGFSLINRSYFWAATAITLNVIFAFFLILPDQWGVIQFRLIDTFIGAVVSTVVAYTILPYWEFKTLRSTMIDTLQANQKYMEEITHFYCNPDSDINYRLSRKKSFAASGELNAAFQRFTQDPKSKQNNAKIYYDWLVLNQNFLSGLASLGSYIQNHHSAQIKNEFKQSMEVISDKLDIIQRSLNHDTSINPEAQVAQDFQIAEYWKEIEKRRDQELAEGNLKITEQFRLEMQEVKHIKEDLNWLYDLSRKLVEVTNKLNFNAS
ncbi:FUSC family protein [Weeksellaceae bacterium KMM 9724]|uniref:FUSC family protein n=1 Tax=Profundicola chukchiensis TaxID=2961959 RepID=UPI00243FEC4E|nr:FUSC family protein [Profundicola chukchiensis]MDG4950428.1 FUSC family protein [Profundicola chukchiensis]